MMVTAPLSLASLYPFAPAMTRSRPGAVDLRAAVGLHRGACGKEVDGRRGLPVVLHQGILGDAFACAGSGTTAHA